ncbi:DUF4251 domain-containing protein [Pedobacter sp. ISL-68]|uniref:DUF4251 domain-containing protein n=1 Tax=unclassified Pedobacter TaxID=2628915 RepID=UPI001BE855CA|nr:MULTISPECIES: DUF4251 domain-containing protein [unclassified Pedobacter]MBT2559982.1 DUF4251 domain-containing protein [Pedobacter sp. ISL-64]MBT2592287.1 DUF4251 domain-containing protein [Pedobacter sp. ISL-68]CAH0162220.1 hypothetical protein SRABI36_01046 [Pedobacter sp. Bi36]CAH0186338.1 hypothetical protein SRABI27_01384 [Pedobacter sp. Bi27]CAH0218010.1 hypothetical protein SRABI126_02137 [Pedobacter sp. Bi126]
MKRLNLILSLAFLLIGVQLFAQTNKETTLKIVADKNYTFVANTAMPMSNNDINKVLAMMPGSQGGGSINLTGSQYDVKVTKDSIVAYLPYFGRSFSAPMDPTQGGIKFTSKDFTYTESKNKKGSYTIQINTKDVKRENYRFTINISTNGYASLTASSMNKQPIIFNGYLDEPKKQD